VAEVLTKILDGVMLVVIAISAIVAIDVSKDIIPEEPRETTYEVTSEPLVEETTEPTQIPTETEPVTEPATEPVTEATEPPETTAETEPPVILYDVPLSKDLQIYIISICEELNIDPAIVMAMIWRESNFDPRAIGDNGDSHGLMQIQPKWNYELMEQLGHYNLFDPFSNVIVGIHILAGHLERYGDMAMALVAYNSGRYNGTVTSYANDVLAKAEELRGNTYDLHR
jgi:hypothetical protein